MRLIENNTYNIQHKPKVKPNLNKCINLPFSEHHNSGSVLEYLTIKGQQQLQKTTIHEGRQLICVKHQIIRFREH